MAYLIMHMHMPGDRGGVNSNVDVDCVRGCVCVEQGPDSVLSDNLLTLVFTSGVWVGHSNPKIDALGNLISFCSKKKKKGSVLISPNTPS